MDGLMATTTKHPLIFRINNSTFRKNQVWNRENCPYEYPESGDFADCYFSEYEVREKKLKDPTYEFCNPSSSDHGLAAIVIVAPMYYNCKMNYGNCYGSMDQTFFVTNSIFEENSGGQRGLFDLRCLGAVFENNKFINNWSTDTGLIYMHDSLLSLKNEEVKDQRSYWGNSNALYQVFYTELNITDSKFENIESQTSSIINAQTANCRVNIYNSNFINTVFPFEINFSGSYIKCMKCIIKDIKRSLSKNKPTIGKVTGKSNLIFNNSEIFNVTTLPLFKAIETSSIGFYGTSIYDITLIGNIGLIDAVTSSSIYFSNSEIYSINFKRILDTASFIKFSSSGIIVFNNTNVYDSNIDGNFMSISSKGDGNVSLIIDDSSFKNINIETGSIIKIENNECKFQISNSNFLDNKRICDDKILNDNMSSCTGIIEIESNINESTIDGCIFQNNTAGIGPALTIKNIDYIDLNIQNSKFIKNYGIIGGGAIYIHGNNYTDFPKNSLKMRNLDFIENRSNSGGALFISFPGYYTETIENSTFINNKAYNGGSVFYFPYYVKESQPKLDELCKLEGNEALYGGIYSSDPYKIEIMNDIDRIDTYSGESVKSYTFVIKDEYGNPILTNFKDSSFSLQSMLFLRAVILDKTPEYEGMYLPDDVSTDAEIIGESFGYFQNGTCSFGMQFYQKDNIERDYKIWVSLSLSAYSFNNVYLMLDLHMEPCPEGLILEEENKSKFKGCIYAKCEGDNECVEDQGQCIDNNVCKCYDGFEGKQCENKIFFKLSEGFQRYAIGLSIFGIIFTIICLLLIYIKKEKFIIKMSGMNQLSCLALGCILSFSSIIVDFREPTNYTCALREVLLNIGFMIIYSIFYFKMYYYIINNVPENLNFSSTTSQKSYHQGESKNAAESSMRVSRFEMSMDVKSGFNFTSTMNQGNDLLKQTNQTKKEVESIANNLFRKQYIEGLKKSFNRIYGFILVLFSICLVITVSLYLRESLKESQTSDSSWAYSCESKEFAPITFAVHLLLLLILITNIKKCWALSTMYAETKHICYSIGIWMSIGPLIQIICVSMLNQNPLVRYTMMVNSIFISQFVIVFFMLGLKVLAILRGAADTSAYTNSKLTQFYNEPTVAFNNNNPEDTTNSFRQ